MKKRMLRRHARILEQRAKDEQRAIAEVKPATVLNGTHVFGAQRGTRRVEFGIVPAGVSPERIADMMRDFGANNDRMLLAFSANGETVVVADLSNETASSLAADGP